VLVVPASFAVNATGPGGAVVTYTATATDNVDRAVIPTCSKPSGSLFPIGDTVATNHKPAFCVAMKALDLEVKAQAGKKLTAADAAALRADIARIESVEGC